MTERRTKQRRKSDRRWRGHGPTLGASIWLTIVSIIVVIALVGERNTQQKIQEGRKTTLNLTCTLLQAVTDAGRSTIAGAAASRETPFTRQLEKLGYPPPGVRREQAAQAARAYTGELIAVIDRNPKTRGLGVLRPDGTIDCQRFQQIGRAR